MHPRKVGIDLIKICACLGVVALHTLQPGKGIVNRWIVLLSTMSVPLFFMVSGYLAMKRPQLNWRYALKKILTILVVCFCWEFLHSVAHFLVYREVRQFVQSWLLDFFQQGLFYHFWYMGALILVYLPMPMIHRLRREKPGIYKSLLLILGLTNGALTALEFLTGEQFLLQVPQSLRYWFWLYYVLLGGCFVRSPGGGGKWAPYAAATMLFLLPTWLHWIGKRAFGQIAIESLYGDLILQLSAAAVFGCLVNIRLPESAKKPISFASGLTMGIYVTHPFVLAVLMKFIPGFTQTGAGMNLLFWLTTTVICAAVTAVIQKMPVLNRLTRL